ncbi:hypothetical protein PVAG01_02608 [Phlyctema vagabunda]|uniref:Uncharacterized protein n=1 Tax=Phlyctema vagabunda TaxID=108571 RepID=A0ABR4PR40_9HELO
MGSNSPVSQSSTRKTILTLSVSRHLSGVPIDKVILTDWAKEKADGVRDSFENIGFNLDPTDVPGTLEAVKHELEKTSWDGVVIGWCVRGHVEFTLLFEELVALCCERMRSAPRMRLMFSTGQDKLVETVVRNFPVGSSI